MRTVKNEEKEEDESKINCMKQKIKVMNWSERCYVKKFHDKFSFRNQKT